ncbi:S9 family peptidase [Aquincola sp. J276]|uniref:S9 family peptidase n=1 Tax=Aquincola sp. J276 TaxID=2898432 RepID=UPI0021512401|nr:S9 family peptidase [Aquincola sp. J276]MCR5868296.1 S9 family peptidase [Aquincola sp. J276]
MAKKHFDIEDLWKIERIGTPSLSPDGAQAVVPVTRPSMEDNNSRTVLWLLSTLGGKPRAMTHGGDKDGQPLWSPRGDRIAFVGKREQEGRKDASPQLYVIPADGGEARRVTTVATGIEGYRWLPDGKRIAAVSWVWPELKGGKAQAKAFKEFTERKESGYATSESLYRFWDDNLPLGRVPHLHLIDVDTGKVRDLFEGTAYELRRPDPSAENFDISPDGERIVFAFDPAADKRIDGRFALAELQLATGRIDVIARDAEYDFAAPRYSPDGDRVAFTASHQGRKHTMPAQLAVWERSRPGSRNGRWSVESEAWDHEVQAPLLWEEDGQAVLFTAEQRGRCHLWRFDLPDRRAEALVEGGWVHGFDKVAGTLVVLTDSATHPGQVMACLPGQKPRRIERFNDALLGPLAWGRSEEMWCTGAEGDKVQVWLTYPPGFDPEKKYPLLHLIHGGPHTTAGDVWHYRWNTELFAAQGYVVAAVNYHGSSSFGYAFLDSITHRWGALELQDIEAATDALLQQSWADPARVFATGGSYGGFMVAWMNGHVAPGRYAAYVCHAGCFDWQAMFADDAWSWHAKELGGWYWDQPELVAAQSPSTYAADMATPTLVIHGAKDYRVPDAQGLAYYNTLKARGVDTRLLWFPDENHWVLKPRNSRLWYAEFLAWLKRHDPAQQPAKKRRR